jgi:hypothetical protein
MTKLSDEQRAAFYAARDAFLTNTGHEPSAFDVWLLARGVIDATGRTREGASPAPAEPLCMCKDRVLSKCPGEWEPGCDLGANEKYVQVGRGGADHKKTTVAALAPSPAGPAPASAKLLAELEGPHGSGLLARLGGAQRMLDANVSISNWVAAKIDNDAADWIKRAAALLAAPSPAGEREPGRFVRERDPQTGEWGPWIPVHPAVQPAAPSSMDYGGGPFYGIANEDQP